jgi:hypothetical protein
VNFNVDRNDRPEDLHVLYAEQPSPTAFGEPTQPRQDPVERHDAVEKQDPAAPRTAFRALAATWRDWFSTRLSK